MRRRLLLPVLLLSGVLLMACGVTALPAATTAAPSLPSPTVTNTESPSPSATATVPSETPSPSATLTPAGGTIPPFLTTTPGIAMTLTAVFSTPGAQNTLAAQQTMAAGTEAVQMGGLSTSLLSQCPNPSDPPRQDWVGIPVMPQATAGQVVQTLIGSYYCFRAPVTIADVEAFYKAKLLPPDWMMQNDTNGSMVFIGSGHGAVHLLMILSGPGNKNDVIVALNPTRPIGLPSPTP